MVTSSSSLDPVTTSRVESSRPSTTRCEEAAPSWILLMILLRSAGVARSGSPRRREMCPSVGLASTGEKLKPPVTFRGELAKAWLMRPMICPRLS